VPHQHYHPSSISLIQLQSSKSSEAKRTLDAWIHPSTIKLRIYKVNHRTSSRISIASHHFRFWIATAISIATTTYVTPRGSASTSAFQKVSSPGYLLINLSFDDNRKILRFLVAVHRSETVIGILSWRLCQLAFGNNDVSFVTWWIDGCKADLQVFPLPWPLTLW